jgi:hypothetical protein
MVVLGSKQTRPTNTPSPHLAPQKRGCPRNPQAVAESNMGVPRCFNESDGKSEVIHFCERAACSGSVPLAAPLQLERPLK